MFCFAGAGKLYRQGVRHLSVEEELELHDEVIETRGLAAKQCKDLRRAFKDQKKACKSVQEAKYAH